jgi:hypothetical protein
MKHDGALRPRFGRFAFELVRGKSRSHAAHIFRCRGGVVPCCYNSVGALGEIQGQPRHSRGSCGLGVDLYDVLLHLRIDFRPAPDLDRASLRAQISVAPAMALRGVRSARLSVDAAAFLCARFLHDDAFFADIVRHPGRGRRFGLLALRPPPTAAFAKHLYFMISSTASGFFIASLSSTMLD